MNDLSIPEIRAGEPVRCGALAVFPLFTERRTLFSDGALDYLLADEAVGLGTCVVREVSETGVVGQLLVDNAGTHPVLFLDGEILCGAKQDRVVRSSVLFGAASRTIMPVYCVERGRWENISASLTTTFHAPPSLRHLLKRGGADTGIFRRAEGQAAIWRFIQTRHRETKTHSPKENMTDTIRSHPDVVEELKRDLHYPEGASGMAVVMRGKTVGIDLFDKPETLARLWNRMVVLGLTPDAVDLQGESRDSDISVELYRLKNVDWQRAATVGLGESYHARGNGNTLATALVVDGTLLHLSMSTSA